MKKFILTGTQEGETLIINGRYSFVNGEMPVSDHDAELIKPILCNFHACELVNVEVEEVEEVEEEDVNKDTSLQKSETAK